MTAKSFLIISAVLGLTAMPALAGAGCSGAGHASTPQTIADAPQSTAPGAEQATAIPYPLPTLDEPTQTAAADVDGAAPNAE